MDISMNLFLSRGNLKVPRMPTSPKNEEGIRNHHDPL